MIAVDKKKPLIPGSGGISNNVRENARTRIYRKAAARSAAKLARNLASAVLLLIFFFPFYWMIITSFKSLGETMVFPPSLLSSIYPIMQEHSVHFLLSGSWLIPALSQPRSWRCR